MGMYIDRAWSYIDIVVWMLLEFIFLCCFILTLIGVYPRGFYGIFCCVFEPWKYGSIC